MNLKEQGLLHPDAPIPNNPIGLWLWDTGVEIG